MIDKTPELDQAPETTVLECTLPKPTVERLRSIARQRHVAVDVLMSSLLLQLMEQTDLEPSPSAEWRNSESGMLPDPPGLDDARVAPCNLPLSDPQVVLTHKVSEMLPEPLIEG